MKNIRKALLALLLTAVMFLFCACGMNAEEAREYAKSVFDASYKEEFDEYMEQTNSSREEAEKIYEKNADSTMEAAGFMDMGLSKELTEKYRGLFRELAKKAEYRIGEAKEDSDNTFTIDVAVKPFAGFSDLRQRVTEELKGKLSTMKELPDAAQINEMSFQIMYELMEEELKKPSYGEEQSVIIYVKIDDQNIYYIPEEDMIAVDEALFPPDNF